MKKICVVTVYNSVNSGSYWQAFVLGDTLKSLGYEVSFLRRKGNSGSSNTFKAFTIRMFKSLVRRGFSAATREYKQYISFLQCWRNFPLKMDDDYSDIYCFVLGSDTIWNLSSKYFRNNRDRYWGGEFKQNRVISYATSVGNTSKEVIYQFKELFHYVKAMSSIAVRDAYTQDIISGMTGHNVDVVCDPTLLWDKKEYMQHIGERPIYKYVFLYLFAPLTDEQFSDLRQFASSNGLKLVNGVIADKRADITIVNEPRSFIRYMYYAEYVVTDTFHGTVFSTNFEKKFAVIERGKNKVGDFLNKCSLLDRLAKDNALLSHILNEDVNYQETERILADERNRGKSFLINALREDQE